jgi:glycosyltransferase involved in cell wall biosynthesis
MYGGNGHLTLAGGDGVRASGNNGKVCILTSVHSPFDPRIFHKETQTLVQAGYEVVLIAPHDKESENVDGVQIVGLPRYRRRFYRPLNWWRILRMALKQKAGVYHFHDPELLPVGWLLKRLAGRHVIYDCHEYYAEAMAARKWIPRIFRPLTRIVFKVFESLIASSLSAVVVVAEDQLFSFEGATPLYNFPTKEFLTASTSVARNKRQLICIGQLSRPRGAFVLVEIMRLLKHYEGVELLLLGRFDSESTKDEVQSLVADMDLPERIHFLGQIPYGDLKPYLLRATVGLVPLQPTSQYLKGIPTKMFEYMACGLPVVASDLPLIRRFIGDLNCGLLVDPTDPQAHAEAILYLLDHPDEAQRMGENGRRAIEEKYNWDPEGRKLLRLYEELLSAQ